MAVELSMKAEQILQDMPPYEQDDPFIRAIINAVAREIERIEVFMETVRFKLLPQNADDEYGLLGFFEARLGLPVEPEGVTVSARRAKVLAATRRLQEGAGAGWVTLVTQVLGTTNWTHAENTPFPYALEIDTSEADDTYTSGQAQALLKRISPAALELFFLFDGEGFRVGISQVGDTL